MKWSELSKGARNVLEWTENPFTGARELLKIEIGAEFRVGSRAIAEIGGELYGEIKRYCLENPGRLNMKEHAGALFVCLRSA